jgi:hypothetical protein
MSNPHSASKRIAIGLLALALTLLVTNAKPARAQTPAQVGDVFVGTCDGTVIGTELGATEVLTPTGQGVNEFDADDGNNYCMEGMTFDATGNLYIIGDAPEGGIPMDLWIFEFDSLGNQPGGFQGPNPLPAYSIVHDQAGNFYISEGSYGIQKFDTNGDTLATYAVQGGAIWAVLSADQNTIIYTTGGEVKSFNTVTQTQGPDFIDGVVALTIRILPDSSLLVNSGGSVTRWAAPCSGCYPYRQVFAYSLPNAAASLGLDPDGVSFWTVSPYWLDQEGAASVYRVNIKTGKLMTTLNLGGLGPYGRYYSGSIGIDGDGVNSTSKSTTNLKFASQLVGTASASKSASITNTGQVEMIVSNLTISGDFSVGKNLCANGIRPGTHCNVDVQFSPTQLGTRNGTLLVYDNATNSPQTISLSGNGVTTSQTSLTSSPNPSAFGQTVTFTAQVTSESPTPPTGTVTFRNGSHGIGKVTLSAGVAVITTSKLPVGSLSITASYGGDAENLKSTSPVLTQVVNN